MTSDSFDFLTNCYLENNVHSYPETLDIESSTTAGGVTQVTSTYLRYGTSADINSSYSAAMQNEMPWKPIFSDLHHSFIREYNIPQTYISSKNSDEFQYDDYFLYPENGAHFINTDLYQVTFQFAKNTKFPSITVKKEGRLCHTLVQAEPVWIWGI